MTLRLVGVVGEPVVVVHCAFKIAGLHDVLSFMNNRIRECAGGILVLPILSGKDCWS